MKKFAKNISIYLIIFALVLAAAFFYRDGGSAEYKQVKFSTLANYLATERVSEIKIEDSKITAKIGDDKYIYTFAASITDIDWLQSTYIFPQAQENKLDYDGGPKPSSGSAILNLLPTIIMAVSYTHLPCGCSLYFNKISIFWTEFFLCFVSAGGTLFKATEKHKEDVYKRQVRTSTDRRFRP